MDTVEEDNINAPEEKEATDVDIMVGLYRILNWPVNNFAEYQITRCPAK